MPTSSFPGAARRTMMSFFRSRRGAAMLLACAFAQLTLLGAGGLMVNYAWREAQWEDLRAAIRAAVSSVGPLLAGIEDAATRRQIQERIAAFAQASEHSLTVSADDIALDHDGETGITTVRAAGVNVFDDIFNVRDGEGRGDAISTALGVRLEIERYEVAFALDVSGSMEKLMPGVTPGVWISRIDSLKSVMRNVADTMATATETSPGSLMVSVVPFAAAVNVADTGTDGPATDKGRTPAKERYVRMLAGAPENGQPIAETLKAAQDAIAAGGGHWVDTFHQYGVGADLGLLRKQGLPTGVLNDTDWNLRREAVELDIRAQVPKLDTGAPGGDGYWLVNDADFWNGCVMARWGAYWNESARPDDWSADDRDNWPATKAVDAWSPGSEGLPAGTPLHLADAPPDADDPHTLFTAYSWPDARIGGTADYRLVLVLNQLVDGRDDPLEFAPESAESLLDFRLLADNDWAAGDTRRGTGICPINPITPLTDDLDVVRQAANELETMSCSQCNLVNGTYLNLGVVWALRTISPLWQQVWQVADSQNVARPGVSCARGEAPGACLPVNKSILIISDGGNYPHQISPTRLKRQEVWRTASTWDESVFCSSEGREFLPNYHDTWTEAADEEADFDDSARLRPYVRNGLWSTNMSDVLDAFRLLDRWEDDTAARRKSRQAELEAWSPWDLFRGLNATVVDALMDEGNAFGFNSRPVHVQPLCRPSSSFSVYGRIDDHVYAGDASGEPATPIAPVAGAAPFNLADLSSTMVGDGTAGSGHFRNSGVLGVLSERLDGWFLESCRIAAQRNVRINAVYIGEGIGGDRKNVDLLERCVDVAGGDPDHPDVYITPDAESMADAFNELFAFRRNLRFFD